MRRLHTKLSNKKLTGFCSKDPTTHLGVGKKDLIESKSVNHSNCKHEERVTSVLPAPVVVDWFIQYSIKKTLRIRVSYTQTVSVI